jgi:hypothetical protein
MPECFDHTTIHASPRIEINLSDINQLFNTMDASPFHEKDLDADAEEFIVSWSQEFPLRDPLVLSIHLTKECDNPTPDDLVEKAVQNYFSYRSCLARLELRQLMREGRVSMVIGLIFLTLCLAIAGLLRGGGMETMQDVAHEGLEIVGWVAMWRPLQIYLYDWWPLRRRWKLFQKLGKMKVEIVHSRTGNVRTAERVRN